MKQRGIVVAGWFVSIGALFLFWWALSKWQLSQNSYVIPSPISSFKALFENPPVRGQDPYFTTSPSDLFLGEGFFHDVLTSLYRMLLGYFIAVIAGVGFGVLLGLVPALEALSEWVVSFARAIPPPAILGVWFVLFAGGDWPKIFLIAFPIVWPILLNTVDGIKAVDEQRIQAAKVFRVPFRRQITSLYLPSASPKIMAGMRITIGFALVMMLISEFVGADNGMGWRLKLDMSNLNYLDMWATMILLAAIGLILNTAFVAIERRVLRWNDNAGGIEI